MHNPYLTYISPFNIAGTLKPIYLILTVLTKTESALLNHSVTYSLEFFTSMSSSLYAKILENTIFVSRGNVLGQQTSNP